MKTTIVLTCIALGAAAFAPINTGDQTRASSASTMDIIATAREDGNLKSFVAALAVAGMTDPLQGMGPFTVFAPTDEAFGRVPDETLDALLEKKNRPQLERLLTYHVVAGDIRAKQVAKLDHVTTLSGQRIEFDVVDGRVTVDGAEVEVTDTECSNGVIHVIGRVLMPEERGLVGVAAGVGTFETFLAAVEAAGLTELLDEKGPFTLFAPNDEAFAELPKGTLETLLKPENKRELVALVKSHVVDGCVYFDQVSRLERVPTLEGVELQVVVTEEGARVGSAGGGSAGVVARDVEASNGVIHVIDGVLTP